MLPKVIKFSRVTCAQITINLFDKSQLTVKDMHSICELLSWNNLEVEIEEQIYIVYMLHDFSGLGLHQTEKDFIYYTKKELKEDFELEFDLTRYNWNRSSF